MSTLDWLGIALIVLGILMIVGEVFAPTYGALAVIGVILVVVGGAFILSGSSIGLGDVLLMLAVIVVLLVGIVGGGYAFRLRHMSPLTGQEAMVGKRGTARSDLDPRGFVFVNGEYWSAESVAGSVQKGDEVIITAVNGLSITVRKLTSKGA